MADTIAKANELLNGEATTEDLQAALAELHELNRRNGQTARELRHRIERPNDPAQLVSDKTALERAIATDRVVEGLLARLTKARDASLARDAMASAEADRQALQEAVAAAELAQQEADRLRGAAITVANKLGDARQAVSRGLSGEKRRQGLEHVGVDHLLAERLSALMPAGGRQLVARVARGVRETKSTATYGGIEIEV